MNKVNDLIKFDEQLIGVKKMPFNCDVCGEEVSYSEKVFTLRNGAEIVICKKCWKKAK